jgi:hypothetical protein
MHRLIRYNEDARKAAEGQSRKAEKVRLARKKLSKVRLLATALRLTFAGLQEVPCAQAHDENDRRLATRSGFNQAGR